MKLTLPRKPFIEALTKAAMAIHGRTTLPILANVLVAATKDGVTLRATDLDTNIQVDLKMDDVRVIAPGSITLPCSRLIKNLGAQVGKELDFETEPKKQTVKIKCAGSYFTLLGLDPEEFPPFRPVAADCTQFEITGKELADGLYATAYCQSTDTTRYVLNGVLFDMATTNLVLVSTDGRRLAKSVGGKLPEARPNFILPSEGVSVVSRLLSGKEAAVRVRYDDSWIEIAGEGWTVQRKLIEGQFPNYDQVIPDKFTTQVKVNVDAVSEVLRRVIIMAPAKSASVKIEFKKGMGVLAAHDPNAGESREEFPAEVTGKDLKMLLSGEFLGEALAHMEKGETITFYFEDAMAAIRVVLGDYTCVIMPMRD